MDALRGMKLLRKEGDKNLAISIAVDFDTTKHLSESSIKRRQVIRDRLIMKENEKREEERRKAEEEELKKEKERFDCTENGIRLTSILYLFSVTKKKKKIQIVIHHIMLYTRCACVCVDYYLNMVRGSFVALS